MFIVKWASVGGNYLLDIEHFHSKTGLINFLIVG